MSGLIRPIRKISYKLTKMAYKTVDSEQVKGILSSFILKDCDKVPKIGDLDTLPSTDTNDEQILIEPRNQKAYLARVGTFTVRTWFAKPLSLSPMICARYGWNNTDIDMLQCVSCKAVLCAKLPNTSNQESYKKFCNKLKNSLLSSHEKLCPWPSNPSSELFTTIDIHNKDGIINGFCERVQKLLQLDRDKLPNITLETCEQAETLPKFWEILPVAYADKYLQSNQKEILKKVVPLAVCGWIARSKNCDLLVCEYCQRQIGLWNYVRVASSPNMNGHFVPKSPEPANTRKRKKVGSPPEKRIKLSVKEMLDPVVEHRNWCPWINVEACRVAAELDMEINLLNEAYNSQDATFAVSSCNGSTVSSPQSKKLVAVWEQSCSILSTHFNICDPNEPQKVSPFDRLRHVRSLLNLWSSPEPPPSKSLFIVKTPENEKEASSSPNKSATSPSKKPLISKTPLTVGKKRSLPLAASTPSTPQMTKTAKILTPLIMQKLTPSPSASGKTPPSKTPPYGKSGGPRAAAATFPAQGKGAATFPAQGKGAATSPALGKGAATSPALGKGAATSPALGRGAATSPAQGRGAATSPAQGRGAATSPAQGKGAATSSAQGKGAATSPAQGKGAATSPAQGKGAATSPVQGKGAATSPTQGKGATTGGGPQSGGMATRSTSHPYTSPKATRSNTNQSTNSPGHTPNAPQHRGMVTRTTAQRACQQNFQTRQQKWR